MGKLLYVKKKKKPCMIMYIRDGHCGIVHSIYLRLYKEASIMSVSQSVPGRVHINHL